MKYWTSEIREIEKKLHRQELGLVIILSKDTYTPLTGKKIDKWTVWFIGRSVQSFK